LPVSSTPSTGDPTPTRAIAVLALASFASAANLRVCDPLLPQMAAELGVTIGGAAMVVMSFALAYGVFQILVGPLGDARGKLALVVLGSLWAGAATILSAAMPSLGPLALVRFLGGAGAAAVIPVAIAWIGDVVPYERRQSVLARFLSGQILGIVFGQAAGGLLGELIGWRATLAALGLVHLLAGLRLLVEMRRLKGGAIATPGQLGWRQVSASASRMARNPWARTVLGITFLEGIFMFGAFAYVGAELHQRFGLSLGVVGAMLASFGAGALLYASMAGPLVARFGQPGLVAGGGTVLAAGYAVLGLAPSAWLAPPAIACIGLGYYMLHTTLQTNATQMAPEARGLAVSFFAFALFTGQSVGVALAAPIMDRYGGRPIFLATALVIVAIAFYFRRQLVDHAA
jgi:MFS transporter, YNFM family, putative membrane transport protein